MVLLAHTGLLFLKLQQYNKHQVTTIITITIITTYNNYETGVLSAFIEELRMVDGVGLWPMVICQ